MKAVIYCRTSTRKQRIKGNEDISFNLWYNVDYEYG